MKDLIKLFEKYKFFNSKFTRFDRKTEFISQVNNLLKELEDTNLSEATLKDRISDLLNFFYSSQQKNIVNIDLVLNEDNKARVFFEFKKPSNINEMVTIDDINKKALHELVIYYKDSVKNGNDTLKWLIITNGIEWFIFSTSYFDDIFLNNPQFQKITQASLFDAHFDSLKASEKYEKIENYLTNYKNTDNLKQYYYLNLTPFINNDFMSNKDKVIETLFCLLSPEYLFEKYNPNKGNTLNKEFYNELLYIMGLKETEENGKLVIKPNEVDNTFYSQIIDWRIYRDNSKKHDIYLRELNLLTAEEKKEIALELIIIWFNRILFLKLFEAKLVGFNEDNSEYAFMSKIKDFSSLNYLFFNTLAKSINERNKSNKYETIPYLNSSLFEKHELENHMTIGEVVCSEVPYYNNTVLKDSSGNKRTGNIELLNYLLKFLDAYDFGYDNVYSSKDLISPAVLGLVFEKINGYKDGSYYTPTEITDYMAKESIERIIVERYNERANTNFSSFDVLANSVYSGNINIDKLKEVIDNLTVCDPAVGSGHFLVSVLNRILLIKWDFGLFANNKELKKEFIIEYKDGDLIFKDRHTELPFKYKKGDTNGQLFQETLFKEKRHIIENSLFGVDINPKSVEIARLRLWIELLKNTYYTKESDYKDMQTLPNIDINIKVGDSLLADIVFNQNLPLYQGSFDLQAYKDKYKEYQHATSVIDRVNIMRQIQDMKSKALGIENFKNFTWAIDFPHIIENGNFVGFDVVIGNPPYGVKINEDFKKYYQANYVSSKTIPKVQKGSLDTFVLFTERGFNILKKNGNLMFILPLSFISSDAVTGLHNLLENNCREIRVCSFAVRPQPIFESAVVDVSILFFKKTMTNLENLYTTKLYRKSEKTKIIDIINNLKFIQSKEYKLFGRYPKISDEIEKDILEKLFKITKRVVDYRANVNGKQIYYRTSGGRYFKVITNYTTGSTKENALLFDNQYADVIGCILSSTLFFWWYQIYSNNHDLKQFEILNFPLDLTNITNTQIKAIEKLYSVYLKDIEANANTRQRRQSTQYSNISSFKEYKIQKSDKLIKKIDCYIGKRIYNLTNDEVSFINKYEREFRYQ